MNSVAILLVPCPIGDAGFGVDEGGVIEEALVRMDPSEFNTSPLIPEYYTDSVNFATNLYGFTLEFGVMQGQDQPPRSVVRVRMSPQHAKIMSLLLRKNVQEYERRIGTIILPEELYSELGIEDE